MAGMNKSQGQLCVCIIIKKKPLKLAMFVVKQIFYDAVFLMGKLRTCNVPGLTESELKLFPRWLAVPCFQKEDV